MEFLLKGELKVPASLAQSDLEEMKAREIARGAELAAEGVLLRQWRVPGRRAVWTLWEAADATQLQQALESLPLYPYFDIEIHPLAEHPRDPGRQDFAAATTNGNGGRA